MQNGLPFYLYPVEKPDIESYLRNSMGNYEGRSLSSYKNTKNYIVSGRLIFCNIVSLYLDILRRAIL